MIRFLFLATLLVVVAVGFWIRGNLYLEQVRHGQAGSPSNIVALAYLVTMIALAWLIVRALRSGPYVERGARDRIGQREIRETSSLEEVAQLQRICKAAFARYPRLAVALLLTVVLLLAGIPIGLLALITVGGIRAFGPIDWTIVLVAELPILYVLRIALVALNSDLDPLNGRNQ